MNILVILCYLLLWPSDPQLILEVSQIDKLEGNLMVAVYDKKANFLTENVVANGQFEVSGETVICKMELPFGSYAISIYHDENMNGELDSNLFRIPKEPVGFSNNAKGSFGPPNFSDVVFIFDQDNQVVKIKMN